MKTKILILLLAGFIYSGCKNTIIDPGQTNQKYPAEQKYEWEYNTKNIIELYDSSGHLQNPDTVDLGNTVVKIEAVDQSAGDYSKLTIFESYEVQTPKNIQRTWYLNADSGLFAIAYHSAGSSQPVEPKISGKKYFTTNEFKSLGVLPSYNLMKSTGIQTDTLQYYQIPRKVFTYPLSIGRRWVELKIPFYRERYIDKTSLIQFNGSSINCYCVEADWPNFNTTLTDYVSPNEGLVERIVAGDSIVVSTADSPFTGQYAKVTTISKLVRKNF